MYLSRRGTSTELPGRLLKDLTLDLLDQFMDVSADQTTDDDQLNHVQPSLALFVFCNAGLGPSQLVSDVLLRQTSALASSE